MTGRNRQDHLVVPNLLESKSRIIPAKSDESQLHSAIQNIFNNSRRVADSEHGLYVRKPLGKGAELLGQQILSRYTAPTDPELTAQRAVKLLHRGNRIALEREAVLGPFREQLPQRR